MNHTKLLILLILISGFLFAATHANAALVHDINFEDGFEGLGKDIEGASASDIYISSNCNKGTERCAIAERPAGANRVELSAGNMTGGRAPLNQVVWYGWSTRVDENQNSGNLIISQIHHHQGSSNRDNQWSQTANFILRHNASTQSFSLKHGFQINHPSQTRDDNFIELGTATLGSWYNWVVQVRWTYQNNGFVKLWKDGQLMYDYSGPTYFDYGPGTVGPYWKAGAYTETTRAKVYLDNFRQGDQNASFADVDPTNGGGDTSLPSGPCHLVTSPQIVGTPYGFPYDPQTGNLLMTADCEGTNADITIGNSSDTTYVWNTGYRWTGASWQEQTLSCAGTITGSWCIGSATVTIPRSSEWFVGFVCQRSGSTWRCGCRTAACPVNERFWQIQGVQ